MKIIILTILYKKMLNRLDFINKMSRFTEYKKDISENSTIIDIYISSIIILINKNKHYILADLY